MANNDGLVEIASSETYKKVQELIENLKKVADEIKNINRNLNNSRLPSDNANNLNQITQQNQRLNTVRERANQLSAEEIVNQRTLRQNADQYARSVSVLGGAYQRLSAQQAISARNLQNLIAGGRRAEQTQRQYNRELRNAQREFDALNRRVLAADSAVGRFNRNVGNYPKQAIGGIRNLLGAFGVVGGVAAIAALVKNIFNTTRELQAMDLALKQVMGSSEAAAQSQAFLSRVSEQYGIELIGLTKSYTGFYAASKNAIESGAITAQQIQDIFESVSKASGAMGLSVDQQQGAFLALQQMISKGTVQAEEIRGQLAERLPGAFGILAKSMGVTETQLNKMLKDGKVLAAEVLPAFAKELEKAYGVENLKRVETLNAETSRLSNTWSEFIRELNSGNGVVSQFFISLIRGLGGAIDGFRLLAQSRDSLLNNFNEKGLAKGFEEQKQYLLEIEDIEQRRYAASVEQEDQFFLMTETMKKLNALTQKQKELEAKGMGEDPIEKLFGKVSEYDKNAKEIEGLNYQLGIRQGKLKAIKSVLDDLNPKEKESIALTKAQLEALRRAREEELKNQYLLNRMRRESEKGSLEDLLEDDKKYMSERLNLTLDLYNEEINLANMARKESIRLAKGNLTLQRIAWEKYNQEVYEIVNKNENRILELKKDNYAKFEEWASKFSGEGLKFETDPLANEWFDRQAEKALALEERTKSLKNETRDYLRIFSLGFFENAGLGSLTKFFDKTLDPLTGKMQSTFDKLWEGAKTTKERFAVAFTAISEVAQEAFAFINQQQQAQFDAQYERLSKEKDLAISFAGDSATAKEEIERQYEERRREIDRRKAKAQKETALFNAIIDTAQAVVAFLAEANYAGAILAGVIGAAQIAIISSTQVPQYALGTDNHAGGLAIVGDGGKNEIVYQPSKGFSVTPKTDTLVDLEKGSKVFPDFNSFLKNSGAMLGGVPNIELETNGLSKDDMDGIMGKYFSDLSTNNFTFDKNGFEASITKRNSRVKLMNSQVRGKGLTFKN